MGLDRVKFHSVDSPLTDANDHSVILFGISVDRNKKPTSRSLYPDFYIANFDNINKFLSKINWKVKYNNSKNLQEFYNEFIKTTNVSIKQFVALTKHHRKSKTYLFSIKKMLREKIKLYKQYKSNKQMIQKYKKVSNEYQKAVKGFNIEYKKSFLQNNNAKKNYCYVNSKLKIAPAFSVLQDENNLSKVSDFNKASFFL